MKVSISVVLLLVAILMSSCSTIPNVQGQTDEVLLYTHSGHYKMSPAPVLHSDSTRIKIENVEKMNGPKGTILTKLTYKPWYGKINSKSHAFRTKHETHSISILVNGDHTSKVKKGDILRMCFYPNLKRLRAELDEALDSKKVSIFFTETLLSKVLLYVTDLTEISCVSDLPKGTDPLVTIRVNNKTLRSTLHWIAVLSGTRCGIKDGAIHFDKSGKGFAEDKQRHDGVWREELEEILATRKVSIFFTETPVSSVFQFLGDLTEIDYVLELGGEDPLITLRVNNMRFCNVLNWLATLSDRQWSIEYEVIYFSNAVAPKYVRKTKVTAKKVLEKTTKQKETETVLDAKKVSVFFTETPLTQALQFLGDLVEIDFVFKSSDPEEPMLTTRVEKMKVRSFLDLVAKQTKTKWVLKDEAVCFYHNVSSKKRGKKPPNRSIQPTAKKRGG